MILRGETHGAVVAVGQRDDGLDPLVPDHRPEVPDRGGQRPLGHKELPAAPVALRTEGWQIG